jgi:UTP-glucose-1-phosphate uridylyltransferase
MTRVIVSAFINVVVAGEMIVSSSKYVVQEHSRSLYEMKMSVTVKKFEKEDVGSYRCIAKNSLGEVDSSIRLYGECDGPLCN